MDNWVSYVFVILVTALITAIITEQSVISRLQLSDGVNLVAGKCRLAKGYGAIGSPQNTLGPENQLALLNNIQNDVRFIISKLNT